MNEISLEQISKKIEETFCLEKLGLKMIFLEKVNKIGIYPKEFTEIAENLKSKENKDIKDFFYNVPHIALFEYGKGFKRLILSIDIPIFLLSSEDRESEIKRRIREIIYEYSAIIGYEVSLEEMGNGIVLKKFETNDFQILQGIFYGIGILNQIWMLCKNIDFCKDEITNFISKIKEKF